MRGSVGITSYSFHPRVGGSARLASQLAKGLYGLGWNVEMVAPLAGRPPDIKNWPEAIPIHWTSHPLASDYENHSGRFFLFDAMKRTVRSLEEQVDVWLAFDFQVGTLSALQGSRNTPVIAHFGADPLFELAHFHMKDMPVAGKLPARKRVMLGILHPFLRRWYNRLNHVVVNHETIRNVAAGYTSSPITVIHGGVDLENSPAGIADTKGKSAHPEILMVSRSVPWKQIKFAVEICRELRRRVPNLRLKIVGASPSEHLTGGKPKDDSWLSWYPSVPMDEISRFYQSAWAFLHPSSYETFGIVIIEAMASGLVVVANDIFPVSSIIEDQRNGFIIPIEDRRGWLDILEKILQSPDSFSEIRKAASRRSLDDFGASMMVANYDELLRSVIQAG